MPEIPVESATLFQNSITELEQAESALELAWNELEKQTAETIARIAKAGSANTQEISDRLAGAKQLRQQLQSQIKQANSRLEFHLENSPMAEQIFGWSAAEVIGKYWQEWSIVHQEDFEQVCGVTNQLLQRREPRTFAATATIPKMAR